MPSHDTRTARCLKPLLVILACGLFLAPLVRQVAAQEPLLVLTDEALAPHTRPASLFNHDKHVELTGDDNCYLCHHANGEQPTPTETTEGIPCSDCHKAEPEPDRTPLQLAYHKQCKSCHETRQAGPLACGECHVRQ